MRGSPLVVTLNNLQNGKGGCSNERAPETSGPSDTQYLDGFGRGCRGRSFTISLEHSELWGWGD